MRSKTFLLVSALALAFTLNACSGSAATPSAATPATATPSTATTTTEHNLTVTGNGTVYLTPDIAYIYVGVHTDDPDIAQAVDRNNTQAQAVVDALKNIGVAATDIQTSSFSVWPSDQYDDKGNKTGTTYMVDNTIYITVRDLTKLKLGDLLDASIRAGANTINSIQFDVSDKTAALAEARQKAMDNATSLAQELAGIAGVQLAGIQNISYSDYMPSSYYGMGGGGGASVPATVPIQPGQTQISVTVSVTYGIK